MSFCNKNKFSIRTVINVLVVLAFILLFFTARFFEVKYSMGIKLNYFTLSQIRDPIATVLFAIALVAMTALIFISHSNKKLIFYALSVSISLVIAMLIEVYIFIAKNHTGCEKIIVNLDTYICILLIIILLGVNIRVKLKPNIQII